MKTRKRSHQAVIHEHLGVQYQVLTTPEGQLPIQRYAVVSPAGESWRGPNRWTHQAAMDDATAYIERATFATHPSGTRGEVSK